MRAALDEIPSTRRLCRARIASRNVLHSVAKCRDRVSSAIDR
jgi:hypothetical protein